MLILPAVTLTVRKDNLNMLFNSIQFALFFVIVTALYFTIRHKFRWLLLLSASCYFYMCFIPVYILILVFTIVVDYFAGLLIEKSANPKRKFFLVLSLVANIGALAFFKYYNFVNETITSLLHLNNLNNPFPVLKIILPIGLSFHTFQAMSYTIEVYRGRQKAERHFGIYSLYVMFYPQLVAGPIERPQNLIHQFYEIHSFDYQRVSDGLRLMLWGFFKKIVIADRLAILVRQVYDDPTKYHGFPLILATFLFSFQIFCDFSGYSDIAIGAARVMGFKLMTNFNRPYFSKSISEFWKRWHISLSSWFRDYLYISLGGNRVGIPRWYFNLFIVFLLSGLWHGANITFIIWGGLHGFYLILNLILKNPLKWFYKITALEKTTFLKKFLQTIVTFSFVSFSWIFFRAKNLGDAIYITTHSFKGLAKDVTDIFLDRNNARSHLLFLDYDYSVLLVAILSILLMEIIHFYQQNFSLTKLIMQKPLWFRWSVYYVVILLILSFGVLEHSEQFIYFQF